MVIDVNRSESGRIISAETEWKGAKIMVGEEEDGFQD